MTDEVTTTDAPEATTETTEVVTETSEEEAPLTKDLAAARKLRKENESLRDRLKAAEPRAEEAAELRKQLEAIEAATLTDTEKAKKEAKEAAERAAAAEAKASEAEAKAAAKLLRAQVIAEASKAKIKNPDLAYKALDTDSVEYDESGEPINVGELVQALAASGDFALDTAGASSGASANPAKGGEKVETYEERHSRIFGGGKSHAWDNPGANGGGFVPIR